MPSIVVDHVHAFRLGGHRGGEHVETEEEEDEDAGPALQQIHSILRPAVLL